MLKYQDAVSASNRTGGRPVLNIKTIASLIPPSMLSTTYCFVMYICICLHMMWDACCERWKLKHAFICSATKPVGHLDDTGQFAHNNPYGRSSDHSVWKQRVFLPPRSACEFLSRRLCIYNWIRMTWSDGWRRHSKQRAVIAVSIRLAPAATRTN